MNNTVYLSNYLYDQVFIWFDESDSSMAILPVGIGPCSVFVSTNGDIYVDNGEYDGRVGKWTLNSPYSTTIMSVSSGCYSLFIDIYNNIYCSMSYDNVVAVKSLNSSLNTSSTLIGTGCPGMLSTMLNNPGGIFVDINLNLYVADAGNNRIQMFPAGQLSGITKAGNGVSDPFTLNRPTAVILDADGYLFIVDTWNNRIIASSANGFRCLVGCSEIPSSGSDQLNQPVGISFDSHGNMFITDSQNDRIQKFLLATNSCGKYHNLWL